MILCVALCAAHGSADGKVDTLLPPGFGTGVDSMLTFPPAAPGPEGAGGPTRFFISAAIVMNACSTFVAFLADVSKNGMPNWSAYS